MSDDPELAALRLLWAVKGGSVLIRVNGMEILTLSRSGEYPQINILDLDTVASMMPDLNVVFMERMRKLSRKLSREGRNIKIDIDGHLFMNFGSQQNPIKDVGSFLDIMVKRAEKILAGQRKRLKAKE